MDLLNAFGLNPGRRHLVSLVGGGGKTTTMFALARELKKQGKKVLVTTTTNIFYPDEGQCDTVIMDAAPTVAVGFTPHTYGVQASVSTPLLTILYSHVVMEDPPVSLSITSIEKSAVCHELAAGALNVISGAV